MVDVGATTEGATLDQDIRFQLVEADHPMETAEKVLAHDICTDDSGVGKAKITEEA